MCLPNNTVPPLRAAQPSPQPQPLVLPSKEKAESERHLLRSLQQRVDSMAAELESAAPTPESPSFSPRHTGNAHLQRELWAGCAVNPRGAAPVADCDEAAEDTLAMEEAWWSFCRRVKLEITPRDLLAAPRSVVRRLLNIYKIPVASPVDAAYVELYWTLHTTDPSHRRHRAPPSNPSLRNASMQTRELPPPSPPVLPDVYAEPDASMPCETAEEVAAWRSVDVAGGEWDGAATPPRTAAACGEAELLRSGSPTRSGRIDTPSPLTHAVHVSIAARGDSSPLAGETHHTPSKAPLGCTFLPHYTASSFTQSL